MAAVHGAAGGKGVFALPPATSHGRVDEALPATGLLPVLTASGPDWLPSMVSVSVCSVPPSSEPTA